MWNRRFTLKIPRAGPIPIGWHFEWLKEWQLNPLPPRPSPCTNAIDQFLFFPFFCKQWRWGRSARMARPRAPPRDPRSSEADNRELEFALTPVSFTGSSPGTSEMKRGRKGKREGVGPGGGGVKVGGGKSHRYETSWLRFWANSCFVFRIRT